MKFCWYNIVKEKSIEKQQTESWTTNTYNKYLYFSVISSFFRSIENSSNILNWHPEEGFQFQGEYFCIHGGRVVLTP